jgi:Escherichia/Staphylococcus phage prohead protease
MERRAFGTQGLEVRSEEERILSGVLVPYDSPTRIGSYTESFQRGAFEGTEPGDIPLLAGHAHESLPVGVTLVLASSERALTGEWRVAQTQAGDEVMALARDGVPLSLSIGFRPVTDRWSSDRSQVTRVKAQLGEVSVVGLGAYEAAKVTSVRAGHEHEVSTSSPRLTIARLLRP